MKLTAAQIQSRANEAFGRMLMVPEDSFGPIDACRTLPDFFSDDLDDEDRAAIIDGVRALC